MNGLTIVTGQLELVKLTNNNCETVHTTLVFYILIRLLLIHNVNKQFFNTFLSNTKFIYINRTYTYFMYINLCIVCFPEKGLHM